MKLAAALFVVFAAGLEDGEQLRSKFLIDCHDDGTSLLQASARAVSRHSEVPSVMGVEPNILVLNPLSSTVSSTGFVLMAYFIAYFFLALVHAFNQAQDEKPGPLEKALESAITGVSFAPMLCTLFLSLYMRANLLTMHQLHKYDLPPSHVRFALPVCVIAFAAGLFLHVVKEWTINKQTTQGEATTHAGAVWTTFYNIAFLLMYLSAMFVVMGLLVMSQPDQVAKSIGPPRLSAPVFCCNALLAQYLTVQAALHVAKMFDIWNLGRGSSPAILQEPCRYVIEVLKIAATAVQLAPMLAVLFIAVRLAMDVGLVETLPRYVETCMYLATFLLFVQVTAAIVTPFATRAQLRASPSREELVDFVTDRPRLFMLLSIVRGFCMLAMYAALWVISIYLWTQKDSPSWAILVLHLATFYFLVHFFFWLIVTLRHFLGGGITGGLRTMITAKDAVALCPMLAILFMHSFVKAASITNIQGAAGQPQGFAQDYMFVATYAMLLQLILCLVNGLVFAAPQDAKLMRSCGSVVRAGLSLVSLLFYVSMVTVYTCTVLILASLFTISPQTATGAGAWF